LDNFVIWKARDLQTSVGSGCELGGSGESELGIEIIRRLTEHIIF